MYYYQRITLNRCGPPAFPTLSEYFVQASLNAQDPELQALVASLPEAPAAARRECLKTCGLVDGDDLPSDSYDHVYDAGHH